jgi:hypothetical protein
MAKSAGPRLGRGGGLRGSWGRGRDARGNEMPAGGAVLRLRAFLPGAGRLRGLVRLGIGGLIGWEIGGRAVYQGKIVVVALKNKEKQQQHDLERQQRKAECKENQTVIMGGGGRGCDADGAV